MWQKMKSAPSRLYNSVFSKNDENDTASESTNFAERKAGRKDTQREAILQAVAKKYDEDLTKNGG
jgi:hypothetical protein